MLNHGTAQQLILLCNGMSFDIHVRGYLPLYYGCQKVDRTFRFWKIAVKKHVYRNSIEFEVNSNNKLSMFITFNMDGQLTDMGITNNHRKYMWAEPYVYSDGTLQRTFEHEFTVQVKEVYNLQFV